MNRRFSRPEGFSTPVMMRRAQLMLGVSAGTLLLATSAAFADGNPFSARNTVDPTAQAAKAATTAATQNAAAMAASQRALAAFAQASAIRANMDTVQLQARAVSAAATSNVPNGLGAGGLQVDPGVAGDPSLWIGASAPTQTTTSDGRTAVNIQQTSSKAILNWQTFNVGQKTDLNFDQQSSSWAVLNRVNDPSLNPTHILGTIKAPGTVMIMNRNGVIFEGASQVNVGALVAGAANITNDQFLNSGIYSTLASSSYAPVFTDAQGKVWVQTGAQLTTNTATSALQGGGYVMLVGGSVQNDGSITTPGGQTLMAAGDSFLVRPGLGTTANQYSTTRGSEIAPVIDAASANGAVTNNGSIYSQDGDITLAGRNILENGVLLSTSSVVARGTIHLLNSATDTQGSVTLTGNSYTAVLPDLTSTDTALDSQRDALIADAPTENQARLSNSAQFNDLSKLADREDQSRIEIVTGGNVEFQGGSLTQAQGGQIAASAVNRIQVDTGATLDVSGVQNVALNVSDNDIMVNIQGNELRDSPVNRDSADLFNGNVWVDERDLILVPAGTGGSTADRYYTAGGLIEVSGYVANTGHTIGEWDATAGTITLTANEVVAQKGSVFNLEGGWLDYAAGDIRETLLQGADGNIYTANDAPENVEMVSIGRSFTVEHPRWGDQYTETYQNPFSQTTILTHEDGYTVGRDAGQLILSTPTAIFDGIIDAAVFNGDLQTNPHPAGVTDGYKVGQTQAAQAGGLTLEEYIATGPAAGGDYNIDVQFYDSSSPSAPASLDDAPDLATAISADRVGTAWFDANQLSGENLGNITVVTAGSVHVDAPLTLANGGALTLIGATIDVDANVTARSGSITLGNTFKPNAGQGTGTLVFTALAPTTDTQGNPVAVGAAYATVGQNVTLDTRGLWVNAETDPDTVQQLAYVNGGNVTVDTTQNVTISQGSVIDVSSGGGFLANGKTKGGAGGNVTLVAGDTAAQSNPASTLELDGVIHAEGVTGGGTLTLSAPGSVLIGPDASLSGGQLNLAAGTPAHVNLTLAAPVTVVAGQPLPLPYSFISTTIPLDTPLSQAIPGADQRIGDSQGVVLQGTWTVPAGMTLYDFSNNDFNVYFGGKALLAGTNISNFMGNFPAGTVIPSSVFPHGFVTQPFTTVIPVGGVMTMDATYAAGTVIPAGTVFNQTVTILPVTTFDPNLFQSGFSKYVVNGGSGVLVSAGTSLAPEMPVYQIPGSSQSIASGADPSSAMTSWLPPLFQANSQTATLTQRGGASLTLTSLSTSPTGDASGGAIVVPNGASITVDPGQNIRLEAFGQMTVDGALVAHGGNISLINDSGGGTDASRQFDTSGAMRATSIWVGDGGLIDVSGEAYSAQDNRGRAFGTATNGGAIDLGGSMIVDVNGHPADTTAFVIIRPGAELNADGAHVDIDAAAGGAVSTSSKPMMVATNGGSITLDSFSGLYLDGNIHAAGGGAGASGGSLSVTLESPVFSSQIPIQPTDLPYGMMTLVQHSSGSVLPSDIQAGTDGSSLVLGQATVSADMIKAGGFDNLTLNSRDFLTFNGSVALNLGQSVTLTAGAIISGPFTANAGPFMTDPNAPIVTPTEHVSITAPYVLFNQPTQEKNDNAIDAVIGIPGDSRTPASDARFEVDADQIDFQGATTFGANVFSDISIIGFVSLLAPGFQDVKLVSQGDIRFLAASAIQGTETSLITGKDLDLTAAQIYPATGAMAYVAAGVDGTGIGTMTINRISDVTPDLPLSVFGALQLSAPDIEQGGIVRAPLGAITIGGQGGLHGLDGAPAQTVDLLPGSITSISANGLSIPYGGTPDGVNYSYNGVAINPALAQTSLNIEAVTVDDQAGSTIDVSGGGNVQGAAFIPGRGGSVDVLKTPLVNANPKTPSSSATDKVYAIVPGYDAGYAPVSPEKGAGDPNIGQQITIPAGVPGLPAGTYTLLPSNYALLPGGYRVEVGKTVAPSVTGVNSIGNGTYATAGYTSTANTGEKSALPSMLLITSAAGVRDLTQYDEQGYADFVAANEASFTTVQNFGLQIYLPQDAKPLNLSVDSTFGVPRTEKAFTFDGVANTSAATGGNPGTVTVGAGDNLEVYTGAPTDDFAGISIDVADLNAIKAPSLDLNAVNITVRPNVTLQGSQLILTASQNIDIQGGATLTTIGMGAAPTGRPYTAQSTTLILSNNPFDVIQSVGTGTIDIEAGASLYAGDTIAFATTGASQIDNGAHFGAKNIALAVSTINIGDAADIAAAGNPSGLVFDQTLFNFLLAGDPTHGAPPLERLTLSASDSVNVFGNASLDASGTGVDLVLDTPAIYGFGDAGSHAVIAANKITWNGISGDTPPLVSAGGPGTGQGIFDLKANEIDFGQFTALDATSATRTLYGFDTVNLIAANEIISGGHSTLSVYQAPSTASGAVFGQSGVGGDLNIVTPVLTGSQQSVMNYTAGGKLSVTSPVAAVSTTTSTVAGGEIDLNGDSVDINSTILLPSGKLVVNATNDITLDAASRIDLSGQPSTIIDATVYSFGGSLIMDTTAGNVTQAAGGVINVSATQANAGSIAITADGGTVSLGGALNGAADAGFVSGDFILAANALPDFAGLNSILNTGGVFDERSFDIKTGDLVIGDGVKAHDVEISVDNGSLTVNGTIDASGAAPGTIRLAGQNGLTLDASAVLDAHGTVLQVDSYNAPIDAKNRGEVELAAPHGVLALNSGATIDLSTPDGVNYGELDLDATRTGETSGDVNIAASGPLTIKGAGSIAVNAFWTYAPTDPYGTIVQDNGDAGGAPVGANGWVGMNQIDARSQAFINAAITNTDLLGRLAGLTAYSDAFHLRPGVEIDSATPNGDLTVAGDIDLSGFRYASLNSHFQKDSTIYGSGEPGALVIRAGGNLTIVGSISDGFTPAPATPDDNGWFLQNNVGLLGDVETLLPITLNAGTGFPNTAGLTLRYDLPIQGSEIRPNIAIPIAITLASDYQVPAGTRLSANVLDNNGNVLFAAGTRLVNGATLPAGSTLAAGSIMPGFFFATAMTVPAGTPFDMFAFGIQTSAAVTIPFEGIIPAGTLPVLNDPTEALRPTGPSGTQGSLLAIAPMLPQGDLSWSIRLVAGADLGAADTRVVKPTSLLKSLGISGNLTLTDNHYDMDPASTTLVTEYFYYYQGTPYQTSGPGGFGCTHYGNTSCFSKEVQVVTPAAIWGPVPSVLRTGTGNLDLIAGGSFNESTLYGVYTAGTQSAPILAADGSNPYNQPHGLKLGQPGYVPDPEKSQIIADTYQAWYPENGGNVLISAQDDVNGRVTMANNQTSFFNSDTTTGWLERQGGTGVITDPAAWWINFGSFVQGSDFAKDSSFVGFQGIGTLGGGNLTVIAGQDAGTTAPYGSSNLTSLNLAVASTGRVLPDGTLVQTGGGDLTIKVGGGINPGIATTSANSPDAFGVITDLRGDINITAGSYGNVGAGFASNNTIYYVDPRAPETGVNEWATFYPGPTITPGDGKVNIQTRGDLAMDGVGDATMQNSIDENFNGNPYTQINVDGSTTFVPYGGETNFTLWRPDTAINLFSSGGDVAPMNPIASSGSQNALIGFFPGTLTVAAANGDIRISAGGKGFEVGQSIELIPSPTGQLELLAAGSIYGGDGIVAMSGAAMDTLATPQHPAFSGLEVGNTFQPLTNVSPDSGTMNTFAKGNEENPIAFGPDTPLSNLHAGDTQPALVYAGVDIDDLELGQVQLQTPGQFGDPFLPSPTTWYIAAKPFNVVAGRDIVGPSTWQSAFYNLNPSDITEIHAGRDIIFESAVIAGPGLLDVQAGRNVFQGDLGSFESVGPQFNINPTNPAGGASISVVAGVGPNGPDYAAFAKLYLDPANAANPALPLADQSGKAMQTPDTVAALSDLAGWLKSQFGGSGDLTTALATFNALPASDRAKYPSDPTLFAWLKANQGYSGDQGDALAYFLGLSAAKQGQFTYNAMLDVWLQQRFGYAGTAADAYTYFSNLPQAQQGVFVREVYYDELTASGREETNPDSERFQSYLRGRDAIAALFPTTDANGAPITYSGALTMYSGNGTNAFGNKVVLDAGIRTDFGGDIQILNPGGETILGVEGLAPGPEAGLLTQGIGNIDIYSDDSILLGQSRILTTFGGAVLAWSADGDINSGRGSKTTILFAPPRRVYDDLGDVTLSPSTPSSGAGIGTLAPVAEVAPGDVDLIAPLGTVDAGEAGIRVSGSINVAALHVVNAANIEVKGNSTGLPEAVVVNTGALTAASSAASAVTAVADQLAERARPQTPPPQVPSIIYGRFLGFGDGQ